ncbi:MAG: hypothetical protein Q9216_002495 [Gyalolechia sp. 2 TL-2023]
MSRFFNFEHNQFDPADYFNPYAFADNRGPEEWSNEPFTQTFQQSTSDDQDYSTTSFGEQRTMTEWLNNDNSSRWQEYPFENHKAQDDGTVDPAHTVQQNAAQSMSSSRSQLSEVPKKLSKRAEKRARLKSQGMEFGTDIRKKVQVTKIDGVLHVDYGDTWKPAVYRE